MRPLFEIACDLEQTTGENLVLIQMRATAWMSRLGSDLHRLLKYTLPRYRGRT